jgi:hypothetical protein
VFDFAKHVLGATYVLIFLISTSLVVFLVAQVMPHNQLIGVILLIVGMVASMHIAGDMKERIGKWHRNRLSQEHNSPKDDSSMGT